MVRNFLRSIYTSFVTDIIDVPPRLLAFLLFLLLMFLPLGKMSPYILLTFTFANIWAIFAASWDLLVGRIGQMSLGHAFFFGIGAYTTALLSRFYGLPPWVTIPLAMLVAVLVALIVGFPSLRVKGPYLALVSMAFPLMATSIALYYGLEPITGGASGVYVGGFFPSLLIYQQRVAEYFLTLLLLLVSGVILYKIANSKTGIVFVSILDDEMASKASGINVTKYKLLAFAISALFASLAGTLFAHVIRAAGIATLSLSFSFLVVIMTILGGIGTIYGPIVAAFILQLIDRYILTLVDLDILGVRILPLPEEWHMLIFMIVVIIIIIKWPRGLTRFVTDKLEDLQEQREVEERGPHIWKKYKKKKKEK